MKTRPLILTTTTASLPLACAAFCLSFAHPAHAATSTWTSTTAAAWNTAASWDNGVPTSTVDAVLKATSGNLPTITPVAANMSTLTLDGPSAAASVISSGNNTPLVYNMYGQTSKPLISITTNANSAVTFQKVEFKIRVSGDLNIATGKNLTLANSYISENSAGLKLTKTGGGTLAFTGSSTTKITFTGGLDMQEGTWIASQNSSSLPASGLVNFTNSSGTNAKITVNTAASIQALAGGNANSTIDGNSTLTITGSQNTTYDGAIGGSVALTHSGNGSLTLTRANTYNGTTNVNVGKLVMGDSAADTFATLAVTVASGAILGGFGTIAGTVGVTGILAPGIAGVSGGIGTLNTGTTTWNGAAGSAAETIWQFDLGASTSDKLNITGDFTKNTTAGTNFKFDFMGSTPTWGTTYTLVDWSTGTTAFTGADFSFTGLSSFWTPSTFNVDTTNRLLTFTAVPEPTSALSGLLITAGLLRRLRK